MQNYSIGAVSRLTGVPAHTLRKWESRHGIGEPVRSPSGRRMYTQEHIDLFRAVKTLVGNGHSLSHLAGLNNTDLLALVGEHQTPSAADEIRRVESLALVGPNASKLLHNDRIVTHRYPGDVTNWLEEFRDDLPSRAAVVECQVLTEALLPILEEINEALEHLVVVYTFSSRALLKDLVDAGVIITRGPVNDAQLRATFTPSDEPQATGSPSGRFSDQELARVAALDPRLQCECPNHIAQLLIDISAFEKYSLECESSSPQDEALHQRLGTISAQARALFEDALIEVATADGIRLKVAE